MLWWAFRPLNSFSCRLKISSSWSESDELSKSLPLDEEEKELVEPLQTQKISLTISGNRAKDFSISSWLGARWWQQVTVEPSSSGSNNTREMWRAWVRNGRGTSDRIHNCQDIDSFMWLQHQRSYHRPVQAGSCISRLSRLQLQLLCC